MPAARPRENHSSRGEGRREQRRRRRRPRARRGEAWRSEQWRWRNLARLGMVGRQQSSTASAEREKTRAPSKEETQAGSARARACPQLAVASVGPHMAVVASGAAVALIKSVREGGEEGLGEAGGSRSGKRGPAVSRFLMQANILLLLCRTS